MILHGFFRSSAAYRVRIALNLKGLKAANVAHHLRKGEQRAPDYMRLNPQGLVPALETDDGAVLTQSLAIIEWLDETFPAPPLLPGSPLLRAKIRAFAYAIACEVHPLQNLRVLLQLRERGFSEEQANIWARDIIQQGINDCETMQAGETGLFLFGDAPTLADLCLVPQLGNAKRFGADFSGWKRLNAVAAECAKLGAFIEAAPERQPDAE